MAKNTARKTTSKSNVRLIEPAIEAKVDEPTIDSIEPASEVAPNPEVNIPESLKIIVDGGLEGVYAPAYIADALVDAGLVETNPTDKNEHGFVRTRATTKGIMEHMQANSVSQAAPAPQSVSSYVASLNTEPSYPEDSYVPDAENYSTFSLDDNIPPPPVDGRSGARGKTSAFPFDVMNVGQSFFVPADEKRPNVAKALASTVGNANAKYAKEVPGQFRTNRKGVSVPVKRETRKFVIRNVEGGARIWRTM